VGDVRRRGSALAKAAAAESDVDVGGGRADPHRVNVLESALLLGYPLDLAGSFTSLSWPEW